MDVSQQIMNIVIGDKKMAILQRGNEMEIKIDTLCYGAGMFVEIVWPQLKSEIERIKKVIKEECDEGKLKIYTFDTGFEGFDEWKAVNEWLDFDLLEANLKTSCKTFDDLHKSTKSINKQQKYYEWGVDEIRRGIGNHNSHVRELPNL